MNKNLDNKTTSANAEELRLYRTYSDITYNQSINNKKTKRLQIYFKNINLMLIYER